LATCSYDLLKIPTAGAGAFGDCSVAAELSLERRKAPLVDSTA